MHTELNIPYSKQHRADRLLDLFVPDDPNGSAILFLHGGGWSVQGGKRQWRAVAEHFCRLGYTCASATYRRAPAFRFPAQVEDVRLAMAHFRSRAGEMGVDRHRIAALGSSAGGHLVAMLATIVHGDPLGSTAELSDVDSEQDTRPDAAVCYCPATFMPDNENMRANVRDFLGARPVVDPTLARSASPLFRITGQEPPFLFLHGDADVTLPLEEHSGAMAEKLKAAEVRAELKVLEGVGHGFGYGVGSEAQKVSVRCVERFLATTTR